MDYFKINISNDLWNKPFIQATIQSNPILPKLFQLFNLIPNVHYQLQLSFYYLESSLFERLHSIGTIGASLCICRSFYCYAILASSSFITVYRTIGTLFTRRKRPKQISLNNAGDSLFLSPLSRTCPLFLVMEMSSTDRIAVNDHKNRVKTKFLCSMCVPCMHSPSTDSPFRLHPLKSKSFAQGD